MDKGEGMFLNRRKSFTAAVVLALGLLTSLPASAAGGAQARSREGTWESFAARALDWLEAPASTLAGIWGTYSSYIDPNGQPLPSAEPSPPSGEPVNRR
jgi:hypothetical protein